MNDQTYNGSGFSVDLSVSIGNQNVNLPRREINAQTVRMNYEYWNKDSNFLSTGNFDNADFRKIVEMGEDAVPGIVEIIRDHPDPIVHALDLIYPGYMKYDGWVSLKDVCNIWIITLTALGKV